ncbi:MAG: hypothetical protein ACOCYE_13210 [Pseudomonadota bacterium]
MLVAFVLFGQGTPASTALLRGTIHGPNTVEPLTFSAEFARDSLPATGSVALTNNDFNGSPGSLLLIIDDSFGAETLFFKSGNLEGAFFGMDLGDFTPGVFAGDVFISLINPFGASFTKNVPGELTITPIPAAAVLFGSALAGMAGLRHFRRG